jgi:REP element-mobilizing transposase RayT
MALHSRAPLHRKPRSLGSVIAGFKAAATARINQFRNTPGAGVWQRNYYEHVVRDERDLDEIREYLAANPAPWDEDENNPVQFRGGKVADRARGGRASLS